MSVVTAVIGALVGLAVIAATTVLAWHGSIDGQAAVGLFGVVIGGGTGAAAHAVASSKGASK